MENMNQSTKTALKEETIAKMLGIIDNFNREGGTAEPVRLITGMMFRQFMYLEELEESGIKVGGPTTRALNEMTFGAHLLINFIIELLGQYERYENLTEE